VPPTRCTVYGEFASLVENEPYDVMVIGWIELMNLLVAVLPCDTE